MNVGVDEIGTFSPNAAAVTQHNAITPTLPDSTTLSKTFENAVTLSSLRNCNKVLYTTREEVTVKRRGRRGALGPLGLRREGP